MTSPLLNYGLHAIDATSARRRGGAPDSLVDSRTGIFRGQGIGIAKAIVSLTLFHEGRMWLTKLLKERNVRNGWVPAKK